MRFGASSTRVVWSGKSITADPDRNRATDDSVPELLVESVRVGLDSSGGGGGGDESWDAGDWDCGFGRESTERLGAGVNSDAAGILLTRCLRRGGVMGSATSAFLLYMVLCPAGRSLDVAEKRSMCLHRPEQRRVLGCYRTGHMFYITTNATIVSHR